ncbi:class I SAM-dependent DNA methyltransferase [Aspergillus homomorphus CBS 101889]|uniref:S-adenosyl-L-methionine-dependent methyltransferase n=1 Tax=Aspergillus homomorphus (strain CBS 101889) TaxID=1450537 RepID=A0A395HW54_ASPHC|nr:S-adenosyl-L-methionine-dependent methyltransferase [Aspergillus homomorphus CBS 101889]RAL11759.1 S-adenosyl-L-methionine-dependent methyltransferase [Aspergillus homomorphus CBS 101889]
MTTQLQVDNVHLNKARASNSKEDCKALYDSWATSYNQDLTDASQNYVAPFTVAETVLRMNTNPDATILDAGCGTGLVGETLARGGLTAIDGLDLSPNMLRVAAKTGVYRSLTEADLTQPIDRPDNAYDIVTCSGTFTHGHVGPDPALREFVRIVQMGGLVIATILDAVWVSMGFDTEIERLVAEGLVRVVGIELTDYRRGWDKARLVILEKTGAA